jgi:hypothetical protein
MSRMRAGLLLLLSTFSFMAVVTSSAAAFGWWVEVGKGGEELLKAGSKLPFNEAGKVSKAFVLSWAKESEVACSGLSFVGGFLEGPLAIDVASLRFTSCKVVKPAIVCTLEGGEFKTNALFGTITQISEKAVEFTLKPSGNFAKFFITGEKCPETGEKTLAGTVKGELLDPAKLSKEKTLLFKENSKSLNVNESKGSKAANFGGEAAYSSTSGWGAH